MEGLAAIEGGGGRCVFPEALPIDTRMCAYYPGIGYRGTSIIRNCPPLGPPKGLCLGPYDDLRAGGGF